MRSVVIKRLEATRAPLGMHLEPIGWLRCGPHQKWDCVTHAAPPRDGKLYVIAGTRDSYSLVPIGHVAAGEFVVEAANKSLLEGRPVYLAE